jgi:hypothetical protein
MPEPVYFSAAFSRQTLLLYIGYNCPIE